MFPVSGAEQFTTSDAKSPPRPRSSAMTPYYLWKLETSCEGDTSTQWHMYLEVREGDPELRIMGLAEKEVPKSELLRLLLEVSDDGDDSLPARLRVRRNLSMHDTRRRVHLVLYFQCSYSTEDTKVGGTYFEEIDELCERLLRKRRDLVFNLQISPSTGLNSRTIILQQHIATHQSP